MSRPRRQAAPDWPKSLQLPKPDADGLRVVAPPSVVAAVTQPTPAPLLAFLFARTQDGRHLAAEVRVDGRAVVSLTPLCLSVYPQEAAKAWEMCAFARLCHGREYSPTEQAANAQQGRGATLEDVAEGHAVALSARKGQTAALAMEVEGSKVLEPQVLGTGNRLFAWQEAHAYAQRWFLPRRRT